MLTRLHLIPTALCGALLLVALSTPSSALRVRRMHQCFYTSGSLDFVDMTCPEGMRIGKIYNAKWGSFAATCGNPFDTRTHCKTNGIKMIKEACTGLNICSIQASTQWFGSPCTNVRSRDLNLLVRYICEGPDEEEEEGNEEFEVASEVEEPEPEPEQEQEPRQQPQPQPQQQQQQRPQQQQPPQQQGSSSSNSTEVGAASTVMSSGFASVLVAAVVAHTLL